MNDDRLHDLAAPYVLDAIDPDERSRFESHLEGCSTCSAEVAELRAGATALAESAATAAPPDLRDRVLAGISTVAQRSPHRSGSTAHRTADVVDLRQADDDRRQQGRRGSDLRRLSAVAAAAIVLLFVGVGAVIVQLNERIAELEAGTEEVQRILAADELVTLELESDPGIEARLILSRATGEGILVAEGLPVLDEDETFELWYIDEERAHSVGLFRPDQDVDGFALVAIADEPPPGTVAFGVTIEPRGGSPQPTSDPIIVGGI